MKTITVLTDFSKNAENAAKYALGLAQHLQANIILYNSFLVPAAEPLGGQQYWSMEDYNILRQDSETKLRLLASSLEEKLLTLPVNAFKPVISCKCQEGPLYMHINRLLANRDITLLVMGTHRKGLSSLIMGNHLKDILNAVSLPVLIIPENQVFRKPGKFVFATDMNDHDLDIIQALTALARPSHAEITLAHIKTPEIQEGTTKKLVTNFLEEVANKINYSKIYYRTVEDTPVKQGLKWLTENVACDLFVMVHRHKSFLQQLFNLSNTQKMAADTSLPLLVYPGYQHTSADLTSDLESGYQKNIIVSATSC
ncbi:hypothetical protein TH53_10575 [Pedobacter lusitanus]|uniref:UspA domain-containing protein n=1 Tax=Pedobacter lusitanus TaxID=1503925 RepID=A0A0D0GLZ5_9SPHI|nr:universal stress protein [Pedobacter lusitanus]KIO77210.1 hypothetical protein TH53_10575 [Pedobacter lusitanus]